MGPQQHAPFHAHCLRHREQAFDPRAAHTMASAMPVLPLVGSTITVSGPIRSYSRAASIMATPIRS